MLLLCGTVGTIGAVLILLVLLALGAVCITERSLVNFVKQGSGRAYEYAKEDMSRRREIHEEKKEENAVGGRSSKCGVDLEGAKLTELPVMRNFSEGVPRELCCDRRMHRRNFVRCMEGRKTCRMITAAYDDWTDVPAEGKNLAQDSGQGVEKENPADVFRGQIFHGGGAVEPEPMEYEEEPMEHEEEPVESEQDTYAYAGSESQFQEESERETARAVKETEFAEVPAETEDSASDQLLKRLYVRRDTRTMKNLLAARAGKVQAIVSGRDTGETGCGGGVRFDRREVHTDLGIRCLWSHRKTRGNRLMGNEDEWNEPISGEMDSEPIDGYYKTLESEWGETKGSLSRRDSKTVDRIRKGDRDRYRGDTENLEQKREERKALSS